MNILILNWRDIKHPLSGGAEIALLEHARYWKKKGANITWLSSTFSGGKKSEVIDGIQYIRRGSHFTIHIHSLLSKYFGQLKKEKYDVVIDNFHFLPFFTPLYSRDVKIIAFIHEVAGKVWYRNLPYIFAFIGEKVEPLFFKLYKHVPFITVSDSTKNELVKLGIPVENIEIIHNGVNTIKVSDEVIKEKNPTLIFLGRISRDKGIKDALIAYTLAKYKIKNLKLWIVGKEEKKDYLKTLLHLPSVNSEDVEYFGYVDDKTKFELLKRAWLLIHPSQKEGWGLNVVEAATQGTPTVGYNVEGLRDVIQNGRTGLLTEPNPKALARSILRVISDKTFFNNMIINSSEYSSSFNWKKSGKKSWNLF